MASQEFPMFQAHKPLPAPPSNPAQRELQRSIPISELINQPLSIQIRKLEDENDFLREQVFELQTEVASLQRKHATAIAKKVTTFREREAAFNMIIEHQRILVAGVIGKIHKAFAEFREEINAAPGAGPGGPALGFTQSQSWI
ncbi:uncharacterized protein B0I36DRAFT_348168 [Microdochium trichocladiopsis]|uniref:Uncharacterized protein n=1 Tax=Microdochium trichocladiopsis TaxID=1682393 RepID=A0A9P8Y8D3_9PEZI|nr:uncharacterized protein B0I36DRAFT_348168 [Microdochium trichocladiopsis]KAH7033049.1 hypothetical protein B0I36DRAFT_348168 [Microdochium trichocladiopsis]